ncbi:uncharacterized protein LOC127800700 [Diospyros lotus]|uniref:uncharacterized protein LOC127800700 n=1 Tax=Diospyros lotus TaxID=55363 RepID=UPI00225BA2D5|nr:uncharacterized protein LOC127800700 [Diospyros lotus]
MSSVVVVADTDGRTAPLLHNLSSPPSSVPYGGDSVVEEEEIVASPSSDEPDGSKPNSVHPSQRLASLDVFRGLTIALMILVDDAGGAFPWINHSPWFGVTLADFVMPFFLFGVGVSVGLVFKKVSSKPSATKKVIIRTIKLFLLGVILQGGYFHGRHHLTYGVDLGKIRFLGVLQRISIGYLVASVLEIWLVNNVAVGSALTFIRRYYMQWIVAFMLGSSYMSLLYGLYVPDWNYDVLSTNLSSSTSKYEFGTQIELNLPVDSMRVHCEMRGSLLPPCNAVGLVDRFVLGVQHLYQRPVYRRMKECSVNSPDYGPLPQNAPEWCLAPFDPEGILSSLMAAITCVLGLHYGHMVVHCKDHMESVFLWSMSSFPLLISGFVLKVLGIPFSKPLYTLSYMCVTAGASGFVLTVVFYIVDVKHVKKPTIVLQWMGMNALIIYALAACELFPAALQGFYWRSPENNLVDGTESLLQGMLHSKQWGTMAFVILEILFWGLVAGFLHMKGIYVKL